MSGERGGIFLTGCPDEVCGDGRTEDSEGLVHTIDDARKSICVSVMDFGAISLYGRQGSPLGNHGAIQFVVPGWNRTAGPAANSPATPGSTTPSTSLPIAAST